MLHFRIGAYANRMLEQRAIQHQGMEFTVLPAHIHPFGFQVFYQVFIQDPAQKIRA